MKNDEQRKLNSIVKDVSSTSDSIGTENPSRRKAIGKLAYSAPAITVLTLLNEKSAYAAFSPPGPPGSAPSPEASE